MNGKLALAAAMLFLLSLIGLSVLLPPLLRLLDQLQKLMSDTKEVLNALHNPSAANRSIERINRDLAALEKWAEEATRMVKAIMPGQASR